MATKRKIFICSSWRNGAYEHVVDYFIGEGHEVWDWRNPPEPHKPLKTWKQVDPTWDCDQPVKTSDYRNMILHPDCEAGFKANVAGMNWCTNGILCLPCGRSAHAEAGWLRGHGKPVHVLRGDNEVPDLMHKLFNGICSTVQEVDQCWANDDMS